MATKIGIDGTVIKLIGVPETTEDVFLIPNNSNYYVSNGLFFIFDKIYGKEYEIGVAADFQDLSGTPLGSESDVKTYLNLILNTSAGGGGGDATAANQISQITQETKIANAVATASNTASINVASSITVVTLAALNLNRKTLEISNDGTQTLYVKKGANASLTDYTYKLGADDTAVISDFSGIVTGIWNNANGSAIGTEISF